MGKGLPRPSDPYGLLSSVKPKCASDLQDCKIKKNLCCLKPPRLSSCVPAARGDEYGPKRVSWRHKREAGRGAAAARVQAVTKEATPS